MEPATILLIIAALCGASFAFERLPSTTATAPSHCNATDIVKRYEVEADLTMPPDLRMYWLGDRACRIPASQRSAASKSNRDGVDNDMASSAASTEKGQP